MQLHNNQVPGDQVWAVMVSSKGTYDEHTFVQWFLTAEASSEEYRDVVAMHKHKSHSGGTVQRWLVNLPRRRMDETEVRDFVEDEILYGPTGSGRLLDVSVQ